MRRFLELQSVGALCDEEVDAGRTLVHSITVQSHYIHRQTDTDTDRHTERHRERWTEKLEIHAKWIFSSLDVLLLMLYFTMLYFTVRILGLVFTGSY